MNVTVFARSMPFLLILLLLPISTMAENFSCTVQRPPTDADYQAYAQRDYSKAFQLYSAAAKSNPKDLQAIAGQIRSLLEEQQVDAAAALAEKSLAAHPKSAELTTALGEVRFRQGKLDDAAHAYFNAQKLDPCLARTRYDSFKFLWVESMYASGYTQLYAAHQLEPADPDIHLAWIRQLPLKQRSHALDGYLAAASGDPPGNQQFLKEYADRLRAILSSKNGGCHMVAGSPKNTTLPFQYLLDGTNFYGVAFDVNVNGKAKAELELDTGSSGILLNRNAARKAGLVPIATDKISGIGDQKSMEGYWAFADDLKVGKLEFKDCLVEVSDKRRVVETDGLIGADVFSNYQVRLDFPMRKMTLSPLPRHPGEAAERTLSLNAAGTGNATASQPAIHYTDRYVSPEMKSWSPFARFGHQILINGTLKDRKPRLFLLDSGSNITIVSVAAAKSAGKVHYDADDEVTGLNGRVKNLYTTTHVDVFFARLRDPLRDVVVMSLAGLSQSTGTEISGIIGLDTMRLLTVDIDYRDGLIHFAYDPRRGMNGWNTSPE